MHSRRPGFLTACSAAVQNPNVFRFPMFRTGHIMRTIYSITLIFASLAVLTLPAQAQQTPATPTAQTPPAGAAQTPAKPGPKDTEVWEPVPPIVTPGPTNSDPPSDAIVLFDGKNLDQWISVKDKSPAGWKVADGVMTVVKSTGNIE